MGMAASQGRLLMMTARISNNEFEQQCVAYSKQRLADESQQANDQYLDALQATQYQIIAGYQGDSPHYEAVSYNILTGFDNATTNKQYIVSDNVGRIIVKDSIKKAFEDADFNLNKFLELVELDSHGDGIRYTQVSEEDITEGMVHDAWDKYLSSVNRGHESGIYEDNVHNNDDIRHAIGFAYNYSKDANNNPIDVDYASYSTKYMKFTDPVTNLEKRIYLEQKADGTLCYNNYKLETESYIDDDGNTKYYAYFISTDNNQKDEKIVPSPIYTAVPNALGGYDFYDNDGNPIKDKNGNVLYSEENKNVYVNRSVFFFKGDIEFTGTFQENADSNINPDIGEEDSIPIYYEGSTPEQRELYDYAMALSKKFTTQYNNSLPKLTYDPDKVQYYTNIYNQMNKHGYTTYTDMVKDQYINTESDSEHDPFVSDEWLIRQVKNGKLVISYYSATNKEFVKTTLDDDESIVNKENKAKMAIAEQVYQTHMDKIQAEDKRFDMELNKLESEHTALLTEYEAVNKVISRNVEKSFGIFNA